MLAGQLRYLMSIEQRGSARSSTGAPQETWSTVATVWGGVMQMSGNELEAVQKIVAEASSKIVIRYKSGIVPQMRVNWLDRRAGRNRLFDILAINDPDERHRTLELICKEHDIK